MSDDRTPLLCIHGIGDTASAWRTVAGPLAGRHRLILPTLPGHHGGPPLDARRPVRMAQLADHLERVLDDAGIDTAHVVGNSLGGWLALELLARGRARSVTALCPAGGWERGSRFEARLSMRLRVSQRAAKYAAPAMVGLLRSAALRRVLMADVSADGAGIDPRVASSFLRGLAGCDGFVPILDAVIAERLPAIAADCATPVVVAWGDRDRLLPPESNEGGLLAAVPHARLTRLPGAGHVPMHDDPDAVVATILTLTSAVDRGATSAADAADDQGEC